MQLTLQLFNDGQWRDAYKLEIHAPQDGMQSPVTFRVEREYAMRYFGEKNSRSLSANFEVNPMDSPHFKTWPAILEDVLPTGYARDRWLEVLGLQNASPAEQATALLTEASISPVGNIRVKESVEHALAQSVPELEAMRFPQSDVVERDHDFLSYARERGALSGGATGAGGIAPKLLVRLTKSNEVWIDTRQDDALDDAHYLVKFPRGQQPIHADILRAEAAYYRFVDKWLNLPTIDSSNIKLIEGQRHPSLWLPRFDRLWHNGQPQRLGLESVYSLLNKSGGSFLKHEAVLEKLREVLTSTDPETLAIDYLKRDLLNLVLANSDNHGRNTAVLKTTRDTSLSPIFDLAPMKADPEQIIRTTNWSNRFELGSDIKWFELCDALGHYGDPEHMKYQLSQFAEKLRALPDLVKEYGIPKSISEMPAIALSQTEQKLKRWGLIS